MIGGRETVIAAMLLIGLVLAGCASAPTVAATPNQAQVIMATLEAPPSGTFDCGFPLGSTVYGRPRGLELDPDGSFRFFSHDGQGPTEEGEWTFASEVLQLGFSGDTQLDYGKYDLGANSMFLYLEPDSQDQVSVVHCVRAD